MADESERIEQLERSVRRMRLGMLALAATLGCVATLGATQPQHRPYEASDLGWRREAAIRVGDDARQLSLRGTAPTSLRRAAQVECQTVPRTDWTTLCLVGLPRLVGLRARLRRPDPSGSNERRDVSGLRV